MGAYENPQVFAPDYNVITQSFQQGFNTMYQIMQQRKARQEAQKKKRDESEARYYSGTDFKPLKGLNEDFVNVVEKLVQKSTGGFEGYNAMNAKQKAKLQSMVTNTEGGMKGLSEAIMKFQTGKYSSTTNPDIISLLDRLVHPTKHDDTGEWGYEMIVNDNNQIEFVYTENGREIRHIMDDMISWGELLYDPEGFVNDVRNNVTELASTYKNQVLGGKDAANIIADLPEDWLRNIIDLKNPDITTKSYYSEVVEPGEEFHPSAEMIKREMENGVYEVIEGIDYKDGISDEEMEAFHQFQTDKLITNLTARLENELTTFEFGRRNEAQVTGKEYNNYEDAKIDAQNQARLKNEGEAKDSNYHHVADVQTGEAERIVDGEKITVPIYVATTQRRTNKDTTTTGFNYSTIAGSRKLNAVGTADQVRRQQADWFMEDTKADIKTEFEKKIHSIKTLVDDKSVDWTSYDDLVNMHLKDLVDTDESKEYSEGYIKDKNLTGIDIYKKLVTFEDTNDDEKKDDKDVHAWIENTYLGVGKNEQILKDGLFKKYKFITMFSRMKIPMIDPRTGDEIIISAVTPTTLENGDKVLRFDTYRGGDPFQVNIPIDNVNLNAVINDFMTTLSSNQAKLTGKLETMKEERREQFGRKDFWKYMTPDEHVVRYVQLALDIDKGKLKYGSREVVHQAEIKTLMSDESIEKAEKMLENYKKGITHTIKKGDTLNAIAKHYKVEVEDIKKWNNLKTDKLSIGDKLNIKIK